MADSNGLVEFYLVTLPGLEDLVQAEVNEWFPGLDFAIEYGGVTVKAPFAVGLAMNRVLKTPTRILVRVTRMMCRDFPKLFRKISSWPWQEWIDPTCSLDVQASSKRSRMKIKKRIEDTSLEAWLAFQKKQAVQSDASKPMTLYVRAVDNLCTLSLDTSGERLHKRGQRVHVGEAPLRETIAAALLQMLGRDQGAKRVELIDPMMGSGTFFIEALMQTEVIEARDFAFERFVQAPAEESKWRVARPKWEKLIGYERDAKSVSAAKANLDKVPDGRSVQLRREDFFKAKPLPPKQEGVDRWVITNPPYGERLKVEGDLKDYYVRLFAAVEKTCEPERACFLLPAKVVHGKFPLPPGWKVLGKRKFINGGIPVVAFVFGRVGETNSAELSIS